jgi:acetyl-CoA carboxylase biotin carboxyl carrier protein
MDGNQGHLHQESDIESLIDKTSEPASVFSVVYLQRLVRLLDRSDVSELELTRADGGTRLVLRKAKAPENTGHPGGPILNPAFFQSTVDVQLPASIATATESKHAITAHLVGIFHVWAKPRSGPLVAVGDHVKVGQLIATIESLNVINEVESTVAGHVVEILVQEGQPVEYGQHLMVIDTVGEKEGA